jgi:hypothetical protein
LAVVVQLLIAAMTVGQHARSLAHALP